MSEWATDDWCYSCHKPEPLPANFFRICGECMHCFVTEAELRAAMAATHRECGLPPPAPDAPLWVCPLCAHDF